jgi:hypothetical protein
MLRNRAKCKLCKDIIESFHPTDYVVCKCEEIALDGGEAMRCSAKDFNNFLRIDDKNNEIDVKVINENPKKEIDQKILSKKDIVYTIEEMIKNIENLPTHIMSTPISHYDFVSLLWILSASMRLDCKDIN